MTLNSVQHWCEYCWRIYQTCQPYLEDEGFEVEMIQKQAFKINDHWETKTQARQEFPN